MRTKIRKVDAHGRKLTAARKAVELQSYLANLPDGATLPLETCVRAVAFQRGWHDNPQRVEAVLGIAKGLKVRRS